MNFNARITEAVTWRLIADLMRRHESTAGLRVIETHPGGGLYDCRTILQPSATDFGPHIDFNLQSGNAHCFGMFGTHQADGDQPEPLAYVAQTLQAGHAMQVVNRLEKILGISSPQRSPSTTAHALAYLVMAEIAGRAALHGAPVSWRNGRHDSSGFQATDPVRQELRQVPEIAEKLDDLAAGHSPADAAGYRYWIWTVPASAHLAEQLVAIVDAVDGLFFRLGEQPKKIALMQAYDAVRRDVRRLVSALEPSRI